MEYRYRTNLKKVYLKDEELHLLNNRIAQSRCKSFSEYARKVLLNPDMNFITIDTSHYQDLIFELRRIGNNINQIARMVNQSHLLTVEQLDNLRLGMSDLITEVEEDFQIKSNRIQDFYGHH
ncbi:MobC family plasmid mobilization relaxosome protein [Streptococcus orisratti]|nr:MobC family plasmid mobilization relaxosome protein [Streptococcus orisratti]